MLAGATLRRLGHCLNTDVAEAAQGQVAGGGAGKINNPPTMIGSPVVDLHQDHLAILEIGHSGAGSKRQTPMGGGKSVLVETLAARGFFAVKAWPVPGCFTRLHPIRFCCEGSSGEREGGRQHNG